MNNSESNFSQENRYFSFTKFSGLIILILGISLIIKLYNYPYEIPLTSDALYYFWYSSEIYQLGELPKNWTPPNNFWPIFVSFIFEIIGNKEILVLMEIQRICSVIISVVITIPIYFLCKKFVKREFAIIGASIVSFDPRLMINSFLGVTDPLYLLLISIGLVLFLSYNKKLILLSFVSISFATITRGEGIFFLIFLVIFYIIKFRKENLKLASNLLMIFLVISVIIIPISYYRIDVTDHDPIFLRSISSTDEAVYKTIGSENTDWGNDNRNERIFSGIITLIQFLVWITIPNFIIFLPVGIFLIFRYKNFEKNTILISGIVLTIPAFYAYTFPAQPALDTRYLFPLFPILAVLSTLSAERILGKINRKNLFVTIIIVMIIISSIIFYEYKKIDYVHEMESYEAMKEIAPYVKGVNNLSNESRYLQSIQTIEQWPNLYSNMKFNIKIISDKGNKSLDEFIINSKEKGLSHIMTDNNQNRKEYLKELFIQESKYPHLKKIYDSRDHGYDYQIKVFEINYDILDSIKGN